ncbi:cleft lip and palate transmembrane protein 1 homolog [Stylophora pistillata]|uniref:cleft lip and palate transmembrane protein 1 homolog n=1 Tax=Stylophora pistillata TaxID=50429 RepID=UPI000C03EC98|nr:cleft lip and palate transmembrane protein 1 homolog [Stylophora pistillata]
MATQRSDEVVCEQNGQQRNSRVQNGTVENNDQQNNQPQQQQQQPQQEQGSMWKSLLIRMFIFWLISKLFRGGQQQGTNTNVIASTNLFKTDQKIELWVFLGEEQHFTDFNNTEKLVWHERDLKFGNWTDGPQKDGSRLFSTNIQATERMQSNGSLYIHVYVTKAGRSPDPVHPKFNKLAVVNRSLLLTVYRKRRVHKTVNLLTGVADANPDIVQAPDSKKPVEIISYWHPNLTINLMDDQTPWAEGSVPQPLDEFIAFENITGKYYPVLYLNNYWNLACDYMPINETTKTLELHLTYNPISLFRWQMYESQRMRQKWFSVLGDEPEQTEEEQDSIKRALVETNPYLLGITMIVTLVHTVFEFLAFKNDIQFWRSRKTLEGLSVRSVFFNVFQSVIVLLYVMDNETNTVVIISCFVGLLIEIWKINKAVDVKVDRENPWFGVIPRIRFDDKETYVESETKQYDMMAFKYLSWALFPLLVCYAVYSLLYVEHKGWYSWVLSMLYGFLLTFGFIMMTPQLFINYKLKSVAHLPWRMMTYKALNTFIDDLFAFVIKMPTLYRLGCFRDDIVFFIYLYQRWIYPIDPKRVNEFGLTGEPVDNTDTADPNEARPSEDGAATTGAQVVSDKKND